MSNYKPEKSGADKSPSKPSPRTHPSERARLEALDSMARLFHGEAEQKQPISYYTPELIQCTLPHSDPKTPTWVRTNGNYSLIVASGADEKGEFFGLPYGSFPRLVLAYIISNVVQNKDRRVEFSAYFGGFLKEIGYTGNHKGNSQSGKRIHEQLERLLHATISFQYKDNEQRSRLNITVAPKSVLWWDYKKPEQGNLWESYIEISEDFFNAILSAPVPLRTDILSALKKSPLAIDVYMWVSYRLFTMQVSGQEQITLSYGQLQKQFGTGIAEENYRQFQSELKLALGKVSKYWVSPNGEKQLLNYELHEKGLTLHRSPLLIARAKKQLAKQAAEAQAAHILTSRKFDDLTMKQARQVAGSQWDINWLVGQYFEWITQEGITPKNPSAHFMAFIKSHRERND
jgi:hypothetical protein